MLFMQFLFDGIKKAKRYCTSGKKALYCEKRRHEVITPPTQLSKTALGAWVPALPPPNDPL